MCVCVYKIHFEIIWNSLEEICEGTLTPLSPRFRFPSGSPVVTSALPFASVCAYVRVMHLSSLFNLLWRTVLSLCHPFLQCFRQHPSAFPDSGRAFQAGTPQKGCWALLRARPRGHVVLAWITWSRWLSVSSLHCRVILFPFVIDKHFVGRYSEATPVSS